MTSTAVQAGCHSQSQKRERWSQRVRICPRTHVDWVRISSLPPVVPSSLRLPRPRATPSPPAAPATGPGSGRGRVRGSRAGVSGGGSPTTCGNPTGRPLGKKPHRTPLTTAAQPPGPGLPHTPRERGAWASLSSVADESRRRCHCAPQRLEASVTALIPTGSECA